MTFRNCSGFGECDEPFDNSTAELSENAPRKKIGIAPLAGEQEVSIMKAGESNKSKTANFLFLR